MKTSRYNLSWNAILAPCEIKTLQSGRVSKVLKAQSYVLRVCYKTEARKTENEEIDVLSDSVQRNDHISSDVVKAGERAVIICFHLSEGCETLPSKFNVFLSSFYFQFTLTDISFSWNHRKH